MAELKVLSNQTTGQVCHHLSLKPDSECRASFTTPGQYLEISIGPDKGFYAIASAPGLEHLDLLVKNQGHAAQTLCQSAIGTILQSSIARGNGFRALPSDDMDLHLFAMGSGLGPLRALIQAHLAGRFAAGSLTLWISAFTDAHLPFQAEYRQWQEAGIGVHTCLDQDPHAKNPGVVDTLNQVKPNFNNACAFWIGSRGYGAAIGQATAELGLDADRLQTNF